MKRAVITGLGTVSCLGLTPDEVSRALREGRSGIGLDPERKARGFRSALTGRVQGFDPAARFDRKVRRTLGEAAAYGCAAALDALTDAGFPLGSLARPEVGIVFGNDGRALSPWHTTKMNGRRYRYNVPQRDSKEHAGASGLRRTALGILALLASVCLLVLGGVLPWLAFDGTP